MRGEVMGNDMSGDDDVPVAPARLRACVKSRQLPYHTCSRLFITPCSFHWLQPFDWLAGDQAPTKPRLLHDSKLVNGLDIIKGLGF